MNQAEGSCIHIGSWDPQNPCLRYHTGSSDKFHPGPYMTSPEAQISLGSPRCPSQIPEPGERDAVGAKHAMHACMHPYSAFPTNSCSSYKEKNKRLFVQLEP